MCALKVKKKINGSFSGGQETKELQELHGANINVSPTSAPAKLLVFWSDYRYSSSRLANI